MKRVALTISQSMAVSGFFQVISVPKQSCRSARMRQALRQVNPAAREARARIECGWGMTEQHEQQSGSLLMRAGHSCAECRPMPQTALRRVAKASIRAISAIAFSAFSSVSGIGNTGIHRAGRRLQCTGASVSSRGATISD